MKGSLSSGPVQMGLLSPSRPQEELRASAGPVDGMAPFISACFSVEGDSWRLHINLGLLRDALPWPSCEQLVPLKKSFYPGRDSEGVTEETLGIVLLIWAAPVNGHSLCANASANTSLKRPTGTAGEQLTEPLIFSSPLYTTPPPH